MWSLSSREGWEAELAAGLYRRHQGLQFFSVALGGGKTPGCPGRAALERLGLAVEVAELRQLIAQDELLLLR
jgi:hypothetical protein